MILNQYAATCFRCGKRVAVNDGLIENWTERHTLMWPDVSVFVRPRWLTQHQTCAAHYQGTKFHHIYHPRLDPEDRIAIEDVSDSRYTGI